MRQKELLLINLGLESKLQMANTNKLLRLICGSRRTATPSLSLGVLGYSMKHLFRQACIILFGGSVLLLAGYLVVRFIPPVGTLFFLLTVVWLSILEDQGFSTLQGSPDGWPIPTILGWQIAGITWWLTWSLVFAVFLWCRHRRSRRSAFS
jgi:hypothetical protein